MYLWNPRSSFNPKSDLVSCLLGTLLLLVWCIFVSLPALAAPSSQQPAISVSIQVLESGRRIPLEGIAVLIKERKQIKYTGQDGWIEVKLVPKSYHFVIKAIGYLPTTLKERIPKSGKVYLYIKPDPLSTLQSTSRARRTKKTPQQFHLKREEMRDLPGVLGGDPLRAFQNMPGVARAPRTGGEIVVRGASFADTGFYIDGHRIPILYHFGAGLSVINRRFLKSIDFYPGGGPIKYGRLTAGLISAESRNPVGNGVHGDVYISLAAIGGYIEIPLPNHWSIAVGAARSYIDAFFGLLTKDPLIGAFWDYQLKVAYQTKQHQLSFFIFGSDDSFDFAGPNKGGPVPLIGGEKRKRALRFAKLITKYRFRTKKFQLHASLGVGFVQDFDEIPTKLKDKWDLPIELRIDLTWKLSEQHALEAGLDGSWGYRTFRQRQSFLEPGNFPTPIAKPQTILQKGNNNILAPALYLNWRWHPHKRVNLQLGVRGDLFLFQKQLYLRGGPRFSGTFKLHKTLQALVSAGYYYRPPTNDEWGEVLGNPTLRPPSAFQSSVGFDFRPIRQLQLRTLFFYNQMFDLITPSNRTVERNGELRVENYNNEGFGRSFGLEVMLRMRLGRRLIGWLTYTLSRAERGKKPNNTYSLYAFDQPHIFNIMLLWRIGWGWSVSGRFRLASGNPVAPVQRTTYDADSDNYRPLYGTPGTERLPMFHQLDLRVDKRFVFKHWILGIYLDVINVYNARIGESYRYNYNFTIRIPQRGATLLTIFGVRGEF